MLYEYIKGGVFMLIDKSNMRESIANLPKQFKKAIGLCQDVKVQGNINKIVISGMGGSAFPGDILKLYLEQSPIPIEISREYSITGIDQNTLVFISSFSGNTEETISSLYDALWKKAKIVIVTAGGRLEELSKKYNIPMVKIIKESPTFQPRAATGYFFAIFVKVLINCGIIEDKTQELIDLGDFLSSLEIEDKAKEIAKNLINYIPIVYTSSVYENSLARIIKIKFNENSKVQAFFNSFPELNHNEMVGFTNIKGNYYFLIIEDENDHERTIKRMQIFKDILKGKGLNFITINIVGKNNLYKVFSTLFLFDFVSYYLAIEYGVDPAPVDMVEDFKKAMGVYERNKNQ